MRKSIPPSAIVDIATYQLKERKAACGGIDPIEVAVAYASEDSAINHFGKLYRGGAPLCLHRKFADIVVDAAIGLYRNNHTKGWKLKLMDGLRTIDAQIAMERSEHTDPRWYTNTMLSSAGQGAHPKGMAVDLMALGTNGREVYVGTSFDELDPERSARTYDGPALSEEAKRNRIVVEAAMMRAAFQRGMLLAPLRSEHWDYRVPEGIEDGWRVLESLCRITGVPFDKSLEKFSFHSYAEFKNAATRLFKGQEDALEKATGRREVPRDEGNILYHGDYFPMCDADLLLEHQQSYRDYSGDARSVLESLRLKN